MLATLTEASPAARVAQWRDGSVKLALIQRALALRAHRPGLFVGGDFVPLEIQGPMAAHAIAFGRIDPASGDVAVAVATLLPGAILGAASIPLVNAADWGETSIAMPEPLQRATVDIASDRQLKPAPMRLLKDLLATCPVALLTNPIA
jgi:(1->4)-alpha-D-glucan 1-alpha-D-glucosylmutase